MPDQLQLRGGTTTEHNSFTGALREVTVDTTKKTLVVHDGASAGGTALMKESGGNSASSVGIGTGGTNAINIDSSQKVGIGVTPDKLFHVERNDDSTTAIAKFKNAGTGDATLQIGNASTNFVIGMDNSDSDKFKLGFGDALQSIVGATIDSDGHVGINDTSPSVTLDITGEGGGNGEINVKRTSGASCFIQAQSQFAVFGSNTNHKVQLKSNNTTALTIDTSQKVGIGTASPSYRLSVEAASGTDVTSEFKSTDANAWIQIKDNTTTDTAVMVGANGDNLLLRAGSNTRMYLKSDGNVGIGTTSPTTRLTIVQSADNNTGGLSIFDSTENSSFRIYRTGAGQDSIVSFQDRGTDVINIKNQLVGIGTTSPSKKLSVVGSNEEDLVFLSTGNAGGNTFAGVRGDNEAGIRIRGGGSGRGGEIELAGGGRNTEPAVIKFSTTTGTSFTERMRIDTSGRVLIGTTTGDPFGNRQLTVSSSASTTSIEIRSTTTGDGRIIFTDSTSSSDDGSYKGQIMYDQTNDFMSFNTNGNNERLRIDSSGGISKDGSFSTSNTSDDFFFNTGTAARFRFHSGITGSRNIIGFSNPNGDIGSIETNGSSTAFNTSGSDRALKKNFESWNENVLNLFKDINPQKFNFIHQDDGEEKTKGFVAQDMVGSFPEAYTKAEEEDAKYFFNPSGMVVYLMKAIQELQAKVEALEAA